MKASRFMADENAVKILTEEGPDRVTELLVNGMDCDRDEVGDPIFGLEAAHSRPRVIHQQDRTGRALVAHLWDQAKGRERTVFIDRRVSRLITGPQGIEGVSLDDGTVLASPRVILATGGFAGLYDATTTGREVRGEGIILAADAGAKVADMEFVQFHPTALADPEVGDGPLPLLTEALRGAGAVLRDKDGERFFDELRGRDEVARAIANERLRGPVYLDLQPVGDLEARFPNAASHLPRFPERPRQLPVRPAAHYTIGGVVTDLDGATCVPGLYACGEVASVGIHGANRLASNSLLEGLVFGFRAARHAGSTIRPSGNLENTGTLLQRADAELLVEFRRRFEEACGVVRTATGLQSFLTWLDTQPEVNEVVLGRLVATAALARQRSLGAHFRADDLAGSVPEGLACVV
jgi:L-aspartate oxidase